MTVSYNSTTRYGTGTFGFDAPIILPRQRGSEKSKVPAPYGASSYALPGGKLVGEDWVSTVLKFAPGVADCLIKTENYNTTIAGQYWNDNNTNGDLTLRYSLGYVFKDFAVDGSALIRNYPYGYLNGGPNPDPHGPDFVRTADGLCIQGDGCLASYLRFYQIPGAAIIAKQGVGVQAGTFGIYDDAANYLDHIVVTSAQYGIVLETGDSRVTHCSIGGIIKDGLVMHGSGSRCIDIHVAGADRAVVFSSEGRGTDLYSEAARIGTHIESGADRTRIDGLDFGPGTVYGRGLLIEANGAQISDLNGIVSGPLADHPDISGFEVATGKLHTRISGAMTVLGTSVGGHIRGTRSTYDIVGDVGSTGAGTFLSVDEPVTTTQINATGTIFAGHFLDLSNSGLDAVDGQGNVFRVNCNNASGAEVKLPAGKTYANLVGTKVYIRDTLQT